MRHRANGLFALYLCEDTAKCRTKYEGNSIGRTYIHECLVDSYLTAPMRPITFERSSGFEISANVSLVHVITESVPVM